MVTLEDRVCYSRPSGTTAELVVGIIGYGYWGPNVVRHLHGLENCQVAAICDGNPATLERARRVYPSVELTTDSAELLASAQIDAIAVVTPVWTHFELAKSALQNGKHVFVEKPFTSTTQQAEELIELATRNRLKIMVDHTFLFTGAVRKIRQLVDNGTLGKLYYYDSTRVNLGLFQHDINVLWDLAPHDLAIMDYLLGLEPDLVVATGSAHVNCLEDVAHLTVYFPNNVLAHINVNWLSPVKVRTTLVGGQKKMLVWNDLDPAEKVRVYDKGADVKTAQGVHQLLISYRSGDMWAPKVEELEALQLETRYFLDCIKDGTKPFNDGQAGLRVVRILEAAEQSLKQHTEVAYASVR